ncbi:MAG: tetratricopeptide repeat protein [Verrucomicrobiota bacterium]
MSLLLASLTLLAYWPVVQAEFINYDDNDYITANPQVQAGLTWRGVIWAFTSRHASNWHPLTWLTHMADVELFGVTATGPHAINLLFHTLNALLLFWLLRRLTTATGKSFLVAAWFALHPLHVESVAWAAERKDVLSTCFALLTLLAYASYVAANNMPGRNMRWRYAAMLCCYVLGLMSKPMLVTLPFVMLLLDGWPLRRMEMTTLPHNWRNQLRLVTEKIPLLLLSAVSCVITTWAQQKAIQPLEQLSFLQRLANAAVAYAHYLGKTFWPTDLALPYLHPGKWPAAQVAGAIVLILGLSLVATLTLRKRAYLCMGWFWYLGTLVPVIGLVQVGAQSMADRYTYWPLIGFFIALIWGSSELTTTSRQQKILFLIGIAISVGWGMLSHRQAGYWKNSETLFTHAARVTPHNYLALLNVGGTLFAQGRLDEALQFYHASEAINPKHPDTLNSIGAVLAARNDPSAMDYFQRTLTLQPEHGDALFNLGNSLARAGRHAEALSYYEQAIAQQPANSQMRNNFANTLLKLGKIDAAIAQYETARKDNPTDQTVLENVARIYSSRGDFARAIPCYQTLVRLTPDKLEPIYGLGQALAVTENWPEAIARFEQALQLAPQNPEIQYNLGYALRMAGRLREATTQFQAAIKAKPDFPLAHYNLGCVLLTLDQREQGLRHLREAVRLNPDYQEARQKLAEVEPTDLEKK